MSNYKVETWSIQGLVESHEKSEIKIPKFQRSFVWDSKKQLNFISSLRNDFPFGTLLVYKDGTSSYLLVDGLQRTTTIVHYYKSPSTFFTKEDLIEDSLANSIAAELRVDIDLVKSEIEEWFQSLKLSSLGDLASRAKVPEYKLSAVILALNPKINNQEVIKRINESCSKIIDFVRTKSSIDHCQVPVIIFTGKKTDLPEVFRKINKQGKQLTTYEILGASFTEQYMKLPVEDIHTKNIIEEIKKRADLYQDEGYVYEVGDGDVEARYNPFEYLFGFGKYLKIKFPLLFGELDDNDSDVETFAFNLLCLCKRRDVTEIETTMSELLKMDETEITRFQLEVLASAGKINQALSSYIDFSFNSNRKNTKKKFVPDHSMYQIVAYIAGYYVLLVDSYPDAYLKKYQGIVAWRYLYDILTGGWSGGGNRTALDWINKVTDLKHLDEKNWEQALERWFNSQLEKVEKNRSLRKDAILFLKYIYAHKLTHHESSSGLQSFDLEHLVPVNVIRNYLTEKKVDGLPINCVGNLALLPTELNRSKHDKTIYQELGTEKDKLKKAESYTFTQESDLSFVDKEFKPHEYDKFLRKRFGKLKDLFFRILEQDK